MSEQASAGDAPGPKNEAGLESAANSSTESAEDSRADSVTDGEVLSVHFGRSANCSSIGSVVDFLFVSSVAGAAVLGAVGAALVRARAPEEPAADPEQESAESPSEVSPPARDEEPSA